MGQKFWSQKFSLMTQQRRCFMRIFDLFGENSSLFSDMKDILFYMNNLAKIPLTSLNKLEFSLGPWSQMGLDETFSKVVSLLPGRNLNNHPQPGIVVPLVQPKNLRQIPERVKEVERCSCLHWQAVIFLTDGKESPGSEIIAYSQPYHENQIRITAVYIGDGEPPQQLRQILGKGQTSGYENWLFQPKDLDQLTSWQFIQEVSGCGNPLGKNNPIHRYN